MKKKYSLQSGFTLLELLVSIAVVAVIGSTLSIILVNSLRGANKANVVTSVRQNGNNAVLQLAKNIREASDVTYPVLPCPSSPQPFDHITIKTLAATSQTYTCNSGSPVNITGPSGPLLDTNAVSLTSCNFYCSQVDPSQNPVIKIDFTLTDSNGTSKLVERSSAKINFQTSVVMRNIGR